MGDVHGALERLDRALAWLDAREVDALLLVGDFTAGFPPGWSPLEGAGAACAGDPSGERPDGLAPVRAAVGRACATGLPVRFVPGNHDLPDVPLDGNVDRRVVEVGGVRLAGIGGSGPAQMGFPYEWTDEELAEVDVPPRDVLLSHAPPADTRLDVTRSGEHVGSRVVRSLAAGTEGALVCGHIHESAGVETVGGCLCYNAGSLGAPYGRLQAGLLEIEPGTGRARARHFVHRGGEGWRREAEGTSG